MKTITLYKYEREPGKYTVSPQRPETDDYEIAYRLVAGRGKLLTLTGNETATCIDVASQDGWYEIDAPAGPEEDPVEESQEADSE